MEFLLPKTHYEESWAALDTVQPGVFSLQMLALQDPTYHEFASALSSRSTHMTNTLFHLFHMKQRGDKIFYVTPGLSSRLAQTSIDIDSYFLKSPYREIFVQIEPGLFFIRDGNEKVPVTGFYVYLRDLEDRKQIRIMAASLRHPTPERPLNESVFYFRLEFLPGKIHDQLTRYMEDQKGPLT
jgi:hypothetical protein